MKIICLKENVSISHFRTLLLASKVLAIILMWGAINTSAWAGEPAQEGLVAATSEDAVVTQADKTIQGKVKDERGITIPGVTVMVKGTNVGTITDLDGNFSLTVPEGGETLQFTFIGYHNLEVRLGTKAIYNVVMKEKVIGLDEVVAIGYGVQKKESIVASIDHVKGEELESAGTPSVSSALSGLSPGMNVIVESGQPGEEMGKIYVRGRSDFSDDGALILVDGVETVVDINSFDPSEIESISVLKDGAATAVYGIKGANGVVLITTKRGSDQKPTIMYKGEVGVKAANFQPTMLNAYDGLMLHKKGLRNDQMWDRLNDVTTQEMEYYKNQTMPYIYPDVNWWDELIRDYSFTQNHNVSMRGGNKFVKYYTSLNYLNDGDIFDIQKKDWMDFDPTFNYKRVSIRNNMDFQLSKSTQLMTSFSGQIGYKNDPNTSPWGLYNSLYFLPNSAYPLNYPAEVLEQYPDYLTDPYMDSPYKDERWSFNEIGLGQPYNSLHDAQKITKTNSLSGDLELIQKLDFITKGLVLHGKFNYSTRYTFNQIFSRSNQNQTSSVYQLYLEDPNNPESYVWRRSDLGDVTRQESSQASVQDENFGGKREIYYYRAQLNYQRKFGKHDVTAMALFSRREERNGFIFPYYNEDWVGRATYNYRGRYFADFSGAYNGDESFANGLKFRFFPAVGIGWNIAREKVVKDNLPWLSNLKVRYSYGETGSASGAPRWGYIGYYDQVKGFKGNSYGSSAFFDGWQFGQNHEYDITGALGATKLPTEGATWAITTKENFAIDFGFFENRLTGNVDFFRDFRDGIFIPPLTIPAYQGISASLPRIGVGQIKKHGYEISMTFRNTTSWGMSYSIGGGFGFNENRVMFKDDPKNSPEYQKNAGKPIKTTTVYQANGYFDTIDELVNYTDFVSSSNATLGDVKPVDYNGDGVIDSNDKVKLNLNEVPLNNYSITLSANYKGFAARIFCTGVFNYNMVENTNFAYALANGLPVGREDQLDYWTPDNMNARLPAIHANTNNYTNKVGGNSQRVIDMSYFRIKNMELSYNFNTNFFSALKTLQVYVNGNNLYTLTNFKYGDPEGKNVGAGDGNYPMLKRYNLGLRVTF